MASTSFFQFSLLKSEIKCVNLESNLIDYQGGSNENGMGFNYYASMKRILSKRSLLQVGVVVISLLVGAVSVLVFPLSQVSEFKDKAMRTLGVNHARLFFPDGIDTSRYSFSLQDESSVNGTFQLAQVSSTKFFGLDRFSGELISFNLIDDVFVSSKLGNIYDQLSFLSNSEASIAGQKIDNAGNRASKKPTIFATAFDIEYAFGKIYMSVTLPSKDQSCTALNFYSFVPPTNLKDKIEESKLLFSTPCILDKKNPTMWGGRITHSLSHVYLSVGEQRYDPSGFPKQDKVSISELANSKSAFGKILEFQPDGSTFSIFSTGHRNAQGLYFSGDDSWLIESEHGPFGGDEVNILKRGDDYGWPRGTFGKPYPLFNTRDKADEVRSLNPSATIDKELGKFGAKSGFQPNAHLPIMSWAPGVGAGNITKVQKNSTFADWQGNIFISLMADTSLHRLILSGKNSVYDEKISLGFRVRDFIINDRGFLILSADEGRLLVYKTTYPIN